MQSGQEKSANQWSVCYASRQKSSHLHLPSHQLLYNSRAEGHKNRKQNLTSDSGEMMVNDTIPIYIPNSWTHKS